MKTNRIVRLYARQLGHIVLSLVLVFPSLYLCAALFDRISRDVPELRSFFRMFTRMFGNEPVVFFIGCCLFVFYLLLFNWRHFRYHLELTEAVEQIAAGRFEQSVPVRSGELGELAAGINGIVTRLKSSIEEERQAETTKNELVTSVSHDLRTPLTSILGYLGLIEEDRYRDEVELRHYVHIAHQKAKRLGVLVGDLFEYTRMRHNAVPLRRMKLNMTELVSQLLVQYRLQLEQAGLQGRVTAPESTVTVWGDPDKLVRVFENLFANAMAYGKEGKVLDVIVRHAEDQAIVEVVNYGDPIPSADLPSIFDRFYRVDKSRAEHSGGSGLGLAIAKGIIERHGGTISVTSDATRTSFCIVLPLDA